MTPFKALYGRDPPPLIKGDTPRTPLEEVARLTADRNEILNLLKDNLHHAKNRMSQQANSHRRDLAFKEGDMVYLKIQPYKLRKLARRLNQKLSPRYYGPYKVLQKIGEVAYKLELPDGSRVHPVFHVSLLKSRVADTTKVQHLPGLMTADLELQTEPEDIVAVRSPANGKVEVLVKWKHLPEFENSWEDATGIMENFPDFHLEDKVDLTGVGNDAPPSAERRQKTVNVYERGRWRGGGWQAREQALEGPDSVTDVSYRNENVRG